MEKFVNPFILYRFPHFSLLNFTLVFLSAPSPKQCSMASFHSKNGNQKDGESITVSGGASSGFSIIQQTGSRSYNEEEASETLSRPVNRSTLVKPSNNSGMDTVLMPIDSPPSESDSYPAVKQILIPSDVHLPPNQDFCEDGTFAFSRKSSDLTDDEEFFDAEELLGPEATSIVSVRRPSPTRLKPTLPVSALSGFVEHSIAPGLPATVIDRADKSLTSSVYAKGFLEPKSPVNPLPPPRLPPKPAGYSANASSRRGREHQSSSSILSSRSKQ
jgi:hypothetical protein